MSNPYTMSSSSPLPSSSSFFPFIYLSSSSSSPLSSSSSPPPSSSSKIPLLCDKELGKLLRGLHVKPATPTRSTPILENLDQCLEKFVDGLPMLRVRDTDDEESVAYVRAVIESLIQRLIEHDTNNSTKYQQLLHKIKPLPLQQVLWREQQPQLEYSGRDLSLADFEMIYEILDKEELRCLMVFCLLPEGFVLNKTEIFYWCQTLLKDEEDKLDRLVQGGFITRITSTSTNCFSNYYKIQGSVHSRLKHKLPINSNCFPTYCQSGFHFKLPVVININNKILNSDTTFNLILEKAKNVIQVMLHLGSWRRHSAGRYENYTTLNQDDYIVVDEDSLHKAFLKQVQNVIFLSLRGTSGIVHFPDSVSNLRKLIFLDLSACNNLESLPKDIGSLTNLKYLDLSECYLLEHFPIEITSPSNLRVLKGFIINSDPHVLRTSTWGKWCKKKVAAPTSSSSSCQFISLIHLLDLQKLTIRTKMMDFPKNQDLHTLCNLPDLHTLGITLVGNPNATQINGNLQDFPNTVQKLVIQSAPHKDNITTFGAYWKIKTLFQPGKTLHQRRVVSRIQSKEASFPQC